MSPIVVIQGLRTAKEIAHLDELGGRAELRFACSVAELRAALPEADALLGWDYNYDALRQAWGHANKLRWIHWCAVGLDGALFPELVNSDVCVTNAQGLFEAPMAEWVLSMILCLAKRVPETLEYQAKAEWNARMTDTIFGKRALIVGVGAIGRAIGRQLQNNGMQVDALGRSARDGDRDFGHVFGISELHSLLPHADYVVLITPYTDQTHELFGEAEFEVMAPNSHFINLGRGKLVVEEALLAALTAGKIAGAALDVFVDEPLPATSPFWQLSNCLVSPHMSAYFPGYESALARQFTDNLALFTAGKPLTNVIDKSLGFTPGVTL